MNKEENGKSEELFAIDEILDMRDENGITEYYIKWKGYPASANSWEPEENIEPPDLLPALKEKWTQEKLKQRSKGVKERKNANKVKTDEIKAKKKLKDGTKKKVESETIAEIKAKKKVKDKAKTKTKIETKKEAENEDKNLEAENRNQENEAEKTEEAKNTYKPTTNLAEIAAQHMEAKKSKNVRGGKSNY